MTLTLPKISRRTHATGELRSVVIPDEPDLAYLPLVIGKMVLLGPPRIRAVQRGRKFVALEGSHRICAAKVLTYPVLVQLVRDDYCCPRSIQLSLVNWNVRKAGLAADILLRDYERGGASSLVRVKVVLCDAHWRVL